MVYKYLATKNSTGKTIESIIYADTPEDAFEKIMEMGYAPEKIEEITTPDRRINERLSVALKVVYSLFKPGQSEPKLREGATYNISSGGMLFKAEKPYLRGKILEFSLKIPEGPEDIKCLAKVIRCDQAAEKEREYSIAVCFLDLPNTERTRINDYITQQKR